MFLIKLLNYFHSRRQSFVEFSRGILKLFYIRMYIILISGIILLNWLFVYIINFKVSQDLVVLHYNVDSGVNLIGSVSQIYIIPILGTVIFIINFILLIITYRSNHYSIKLERFFAHLLLSSVILVNIFLFSALVILYLINFII